MTSFQQPRRLLSYLNQKISIRDSSSRPEVVDHFPLAYETNEELGKQRQVDTLLSCFEQAASLVALGSTR